MHADVDQVLAFVKDRIQADVRANSPRRARDRADLQHAQFYRGGEENHWTVWDSSAQNYVPRPMDGDTEAALPPWFFRATSNLFAVKIDGIAAILNQSKPAQEVGPARDTDTDRAAAEIAQEALPRLYEECDYVDLRAQIHKLIALTNAVAVVVDYDNNERHGVDEMQVNQCPECGQFAMPHDEQCPDCQGPTSPAFFPEGSPQAGFPVTQEFPKGKLEMRVLSSFEFSYPRSARELLEERMPWIASHHRMDAGEVTRNWPKAQAHLDANGQQRTSGANASTQSVQYGDRLAGLSSPLGSGTTRSSDGAATVSPSGPVIWRVWVDPVDDGTFYFPEGLYAVLLDDAVVLESGPLPFVDDNGKPIKNVLVRSFQSTPGSGWGKPPADDMAPIQKQLNLCLALAFLILMNDAAPTTWVPDTVTLLDDLTGMPGSVNRFQSQRPGDKPFVTGGAGFSESLKWFIEFLVNQMDVVSKLNAVLTGARPEGGDPTAFEVQTLAERGMAAFKEPLDALVNFEKRLSKLLLTIARQTMWSPRFYTVAGDNGEWEVKQFLGADLSGDVSIHVEPATAWPPSALLQNLRLDQAIQRGILNPADPEVQSEYLSLNNLTSFKKSTDEDKAQVARQIDAWRQAVDPRQIAPPDPLWNLPFHFFKKVQWLKTEAAEQLQAEQPAVYAAIRQHVGTIQQMMMPAAPPAPGPPDGSRVNAAIDAGAIKPARPKGAPADGKKLNALLDQGALRPASQAPKK